MNRLEQDNPRKNGNSMLTVKGKRFVCDCGCNVFGKHKDLTEDGYELYSCNCCDAMYETEPKKEKENEQNINR